MPIRTAALACCLSLLLLAACAGPDAAKQSTAPPVASAASVASPEAEMALPSGYAYPPGDTVRVVTWNVEHFVDAHDNPYIDNEREDDPSADMAARRGRFAEALRRLDADVVVLQEFESAAYAERMAAERLPEMGYRFFAGTESRDWYMNVVVMSRLPLGVVRSYAGVTTPILGQVDDEGRPAAQAFTNNRLWMADVLARPGYTFTLAGLHLKAGRGGRNAAWRTGQIRFLRGEMARLTASRPAANLLVAGDLNALPDSPELAQLLEGPPGPVQLVDPLAGQPALTHPVGNPARQLDYILVSESMQPELVGGSVQVAMPLPQDAMAQTSDHLPVKAAFVAREQ